MEKKTLNTKPPELKFESYFKFVLSCLAQYQSCVFKQVYMAPERFHRWMTWPQSSCQERQVFRRGSIVCWLLLSGRRRTGRTGTEPDPPHTHTKQVEKILNPLTKHFKTSNPHPLPVRQKRKQHWHMIIQFCFLVLLNISDQFSQTKT